MTDTSEIVFYVLRLGALFVFVWIIGSGIGSLACDRKTQNLGVPHRYAYIGGCQVQHVKAGWIPLETYRVPE